MKLKRNIANKTVARNVVDDVPTVDAEFLKALAFEVEIETEPSLEEAIRDAFAAWFPNEKKKES